MRAEVSRQVQPSNRYDLGLLDSLVYSLPAI
jgi:hypothetical protein